MPRPKEHRKQMLIVCVEPHMNRPATIYHETLCEHCSLPPASHNLPLSVGFSQPYASISRVYIACDRCDEWYHAECVGLTSQQAATHAGTYLCPRCTEVQPPDSLAPKKSEEVHLKEEDPDSNTKTLYEMALTAALQSQLAVLLRELQEHKMAWPFLQLPDPEKYPAIESLEDPKTLARIAERLTVGQYTTLGDFSFAMNSLFFDARILYLKGTPEFHCTEVMEALFIRKMKELKTRFTPTC
ncbi:putative Bromodomain containing protein [Fasciola gigantica]|uniref:Putative Bromodomain containing protein n=1 Tax=Fasciola gigantica TaxID=46835 RepID=A0A504Z252_FASGI|nr:putative Bromodomain containing protein [Fasciola gigantica]